jgi:hypothetical protein
VERLFGLEREAQSRLNQSASGGVALIIGIASLYWYRLLLLLPRVESLDHADI